MLSDKLSFNKVFIYFSFLFFLFSKTASGQGCCSGGCGSPIAGGGSPGVLMAKQMEIGSSFQYMNGNKFYARDKDTVHLFDNFNSQYVYTRLAYGFTRDLTVSLEAGYYLNKSEMGLHKTDSFKIKGIGDLLIFPKYDVYNNVDERRKIEFTVGLGYKIPLGKHNDSTLVYTNPINGRETWAKNPPLVQATTGSQDVVMYAFFFRGFPKHNFRVYANSTYIRKGWNSLGEKFGDYSSVGLFFGKTILKSLGITLQVKGEWIGKMSYNKDIDVKLLGGGNSMMALYNIDVKSTGSKKILFIPQISYSIKSFSIYALGEIPLYQYVNGAQVVVTPLTFGVAYRFFTSKNLTAKTGEIIYECPMKCKGSESKEPGTCPVCGMQLIEKK
ncbi:MAG TPA: heavy metal-binding domain-containing protein [Bacteroidia bacterium]